MAFGLSAGAVALIGAGATVAGGVMASNASKSAAKTQAAAADRASEQELEMFNRQVELQEPWRQAGGLGLNALMSGLGLSPTGTFQPTGAPQQRAPVAAPQGMQAQPRQAGAPQQAAPGETMEQIRARLTPQFTTRGLLKSPATDANDDVYDPDITDTKGLDAAVQAEMARQQGPRTQTVTPPLNANERPAGYGNLLQDFESKTYKPGSFQAKEFTAADFEADPGYEFRMEEGLRAQDRAASAGGRFNSGRAFKDMQRFSQGLASQEYGNAFNRFNVGQDNQFRAFALNEGNRAGAFNMNETNRFNTFQSNQGNRFNRLAALSGIGQTATNQVTGAAGSYGAAAGANTIGAGNARAAGQVGSANAINGAISQGVGSYQTNQLLNRFMPNNAPNSMYGAPANPYYQG